MDVLQSKKRPRLKRSRTSPVVAKDLRSHHDSDFDSDEESKNMLHDMVATTCSDGLREVLRVSGPSTPSGKRKRKGQRTQAAMRVSSSPVRSTHHRASSLERLVKEVNSQGRVPFNDLEEVKRLVDGAMRLSIYGINRTPTGLKVKANTFAVGLADIAPALWRPGYLAVGTASHCSWKEADGSRLYRSVLIYCLLSVAPSINLMESGSCQTH
jgi:hypothetical protein